MEIRHAKCRIKNYPRPQFVRENWVNLNGKWDFRFDDDEVGVKQRYAQGFTPETTINVPFAFQTAASGIGREKTCPLIWYQKKLDLKFNDDERVLLNLEGSDWETEVYLNGVFCGKDTGCYHRETFDLTDAAKQGENLLVLAIRDDYSEMKPRGKQRAKDHDYGCWYIDTSGLYKTAWLETVSARHIKRLKITPSLKDKNVTMKFCFSGNVEGLTLNAEVSYDGEQVATGSVPAECGAELTLSLDKRLELWSVGDGRLYDVVLTLCDGDKVVDKVGSYFGLRDITIKDGKVFVNGEFVYQKLVLDQGYWHGSDLTAPDEEALEKDLLYTLGFGFNGVRKHEKVEDERYLYYADVYGFIVWAEMPSVYNFRVEACANFKREWLLAVKQQYNHPCVFTWVPFNESWGIEHIKSDLTEQTFVNDIYYATKALDPTRPVVTNDGWEHTISDLLTMHHYTQSGEELYNVYNTVEKCTMEKYASHSRGAFADGYSYKGQPIMLSEFGGTSFVKDVTGNKWGYGESVKSEEEFLERFGSLVNAIYSSPHIVGFCYTQITDVHHEVNGLLDFDRNHKLPPEKISAIINKKK